MALHDNVFDVIDGFYAAGGGELPWAVAWDRLLQATRFAGASIFSFDRQARVGACMERRPVSAGIWHRIDPDFGRRYSDEGYCHIDPQRRFLLDNLATIRIRYDALHSTEAEMDRDPYYALVERHTGHRYYLGAQTDPAQGIGATICLHRPRAAGHATPEEIALFGALMPHFERAFLLERRLGLALTPGGAAAALLDLNPTGILVIDAHGRVAFANRAAEAMAARADGFALLPDGMHALRAGDDAKLQRLIGAAVKPEKRGGGALRLARKTGARDYTVQVMPLPPTAAIVASVVPAACVLIADPTALAPPVGHLLGPLYGLTATETRVAEQLAAGDTIEQAAQALGMAWATARSHLAAIFRKTGTRRQPELMRLLLTLPAGIGSAELEPVDPQAAITRGRPVSADT
ncbi:helix-turn-helix transcriptional regulator [Desertibaculum subflavum]|uniref:helix-turn-helix transcriptional regulator n=1 Tax=Desertibaculum subflavum TaxID=2268458 RepID=UPI000E662B46